MLLNAASAEDTGSDWAPETFSLDNGLTVVVLPDHRVPVVTHMMWYRVGAADEPPGKSGIAHFLEHLMFKGTENLAPGEFSRVVARNGGQDNAFTSQDYTGYFQRVAIDRLPIVMQMEADRMTGLVLTDDVVLPERDVVLEERSARIENNPESLLGERMSAALYKVHPYGIPIIGFEEEIRALTRQDAIDFYRVHYAPNNAILVVAGDITAERLRPLAEQYYGGIPPADVPPRVRPEEPPMTEPARVDYRDPRVLQPSFRRIYRAPSYATAGPGVAEAIDVLAQILGTGPTSRLYRALLIEGAVAASAGAYYAGTALDNGTFGLFATPRPGVALETVEAAIDQVIADLLAGGITDAELQRAKTNLVADTIYARDNQRWLAQAYGSGLTTGLTVADVTAYPDRIAEVTAGQVLQVARDLLQSPAHVTGYLQPEDRS